MTPIILFSIFLTLGGMLSMFGSSLDWAWYWRWCGFTDKEIALRTKAYHLVFGFFATLSGFWIIINYISHIGIELSLMIGLGITISLLKIADYMSEGNVIYYLFNHKSKR